jgi:hypothetical protein
MERRRKEQLTARDPKRAWETIKGMILDDEDMTVEELNAELRGYGIDPDESVIRLFELARRMSRRPSAGGRVSPHVSEILIQLEARYYQLLAKAAEAEASDSVRPRQCSIQEGDGMPVPVKPKALAAVLTYNRNYKEETPKDRAIRLRNERRLLEMGEDTDQGEGDSKK